MKTSIEMVAQIKVAKTATWKMDPLEFRSRLEEAISSTLRDCVKGKSKTDVYITLYIGAPLIRISKVALKEAGK